MGCTVIIPSRNDKHLNRTVTEMLQKAEGDVEVVTIIDGPTEYPLPSPDPRLHVIELPVAKGMRNAINLGAKVSNQKYLMKIDSHCAISQGYDTQLQQCEDNWVVIGLRQELSEDWVIHDTPIGYWYMSSPWTSGQGYMRDCRWVSRDKAHASLMLDESMTISGSMWFMSKSHFERIGGMDDVTFGPWSGEPQELSCKTWLSGGKVMVNKNVTYAHMRGERGYHIQWKYALRGLRRVTQYWANDEWPQRTHIFKWLVDHFWPLPMEHTRVRGEKYYWEPDWCEKYYHVQ